MALAAYAASSACGRRQAAPAPLAPAAISDAPQVNDALAPDEVAVDIFAPAAADHWTPIRNSGGATEATVRLTAARDAALVTWQDYGQLWCGWATREDECAGGRVLLLVVKPEALAAAAAPGDRDTPIAVTVNGRAQLHLSGPNFGPDIRVRGDVRAVPRQLHGFQILVDYGSRKSFHRQLQRCRTVEVRLLGRSFRFGCDHLPTDV